MYHTFICILLYLKCNIVQNSSEVKPYHCSSTEAEQSHRDADCFACAILSHGFDGGHVYGIDNYITLDKLISPFKGPGPTSLAGKPKLFFIQVT
jgi:hypothetical protein